MLIATLFLQVLRAKTFVQDEYLKEIQAKHDEDYFYFKYKCYYSYKKHENPHILQAGLYVIFDQVIDVRCTCGAVKHGYCNHTLPLM